jgi:hypothetical protein
MGTFSITNGEGKFIGRTTMDAVLSWVGPAHAYCYATEAEAKQTKRAFNFTGTVCPSPKWNATTKRYEVSA